MRGVLLAQGFDNYACNIIVLAHTTPPASRDFGVWRQSLLTELERIVRKNGAQLNHMRQVWGNNRLSDAYIATLHATAVIYTGFKLTQKEVGCLS
jgi:hypothetical protein